MDDLERRDDDTRAQETDDLDRASENVLGVWPSAGVEDAADDGPASVEEAFERGEPDADDEAADAPDVGASAVDVGTDSAEPDVVTDEPEALESSGEHAPGMLAIPPGYPVLEGEPHGARRAVGIVVSRFNGEATAALLDSALRELTSLGVDQDSITVMPVPGAFELPIAAMALAKTRRFACIVALGCVIRGDTPHFDYVASEAASGLQLAAIETGVPVSFGVLTLDRQDQAEARLDKGAEAVRTALEMADLFANLRAAAAR